MFSYEQYRCVMTRQILLQGESEIRAEFSKLDSDNSGYITKGAKKKTKKILFKSSLHLTDEMISVITDCDHFSGDKVRLPGIKLVL